MNTTLNEIRSHDPCSDGWEKLLKHLGKLKADDEPLSYIEILESNGINDAIWALRCADTEYSYIVRLFAAKCAESVLHIYEKNYPDDPRVKNCINTSRMYALDLVDNAARDAARAAARAAARDAARDASWDADRAADRNAARDAAWAADRAADRDDAWDAARAAARAADRDASSAACSAAFSAAFIGEREKQAEWFKEYFTEAKSLEHYQDTERLLA